MFSHCKFLVAGLFLCSIFANAFSLEIVSAYVDAKLQKIKDQLAESYLGRRSDILAAEQEVKNDYKGHWNNLWSEAPKSIRPRSIDFFDETFLLSGNEIFSIYQNEAAVEPTRIINKLQLSPAKGPVNFIKSFFWNGRTFLLVCQIYSCTHYLGSNIANLNNEQTIEYNHLLPVDASFFALKDQVYLIISYKTGGSLLANNPTPSNIYGWTETEMNFTAQVLTPTVEALGTFYGEGSIIVIFALKDNLISDSMETVSCILYELKDPYNIEFTAYLSNRNPIRAIYPYNYDEEKFAILVSDNNSSGIYWWDGNNLQEWINIPEINSSSSLNILSINDEKLLFVCNSKVLHIYRITFRKCMKVNELDLKGEERVVEIKAWKNENAIMLVIIKYNLVGNTYQTDLWQLKLHQETVNSDKIWNCFKELSHLLNSRMPVIQNFKNNWSKLLPATKNLSVFVPLQLPSLFIDAGQISLLEFDNEETISSPIDVQNALTKLEINIYASRAASAGILINDDKLFSLSGKIRVNENAYFKKLYIDSLQVEYLNSTKIPIETTFLPEIDQNFAKPLKAKNIYVDNLEVPTLCGLEKSNWLYVNDTKKIKFSDVNVNSSLLNDTIFLNSSLTLEDLNVETINDVNLRNFFRDIFLIDYNQVIEGNIICRGPIKTMNLTVGSVNNISSSALITKHTNQRLTDVFFDTLHVQQVHVETINGVPINKAARISRENVIKGKVLISNLIVTDELIIHESIHFPYLRPTQIYDEIVIEGNIFVKNLDLGTQSALVIDQTEQNIYNVLENSWRKSKNQTVEHSLIFDKGATIDELVCHRLNNYEERDFIFTHTDIIDQIENVTFLNFHFKDVASNDSKIAETFLKESPHSVTFLKPVRITNLTVDNFFMENYNGIPVDFIMQPNDTLKFLGFSQFQAVRVDGQMFTDSIQMNYLNRREAFLLKEALRFNQDVHVDSLKVDSLKTKHLQVQKLNGKNLEQALQSQENLLNQSDINIHVNSRMEIENSLQVEKINDYDFGDYISNVLKLTDLESLIDFANIKTLHLTNNLNVKFLNNQKVQEIFTHALSKTSNQVLPEEYTVKNLKINYLKTKTINNNSVSKLMFTDEPCTFHGEITFSELYVKGNTTTNLLQGKPISEIQKQLQRIPMKDLISLYVYGNVFWESSLSSLHSINYLLNNAVTKNKNQYINSSVNFEDHIQIDSLFLKQDSLILQKISEIIDDSVIENPDLSSISVKGTKIFKAGLEINDLEVKHNIDIGNINGLDFEKTVSEIFQKYDNDTVLAELTFLEPIQVDNLNTKVKKIHDTPFYELAAKNQRMPKNLHFNRLIVQGNVSLHQLDDVNFNDFKEKRVTIHEDFEIFADVKFTNSVIVSNESFVSSINGMKPTNLVTNTNNSVPNLIYGKKTFLSKLDVEENIQVNGINNLNMSSTLSSDKDIDVIGNLIFERNVENLGNVTVAGQVNGLETQRIISSQLELENLGNLLSKKESLIDHLITSSVNSSSIIGNYFFYLERDEEIDVHIAGVQNLRSMEIAPLTQLDVYTSEAAAFCGLPTDCFCRGQYIIEIPSTAGNYTIQEKSTSNVTFNFYFPHNQFGLKIVNGAFSTSEHCSISSSERSEILWTKFDNRSNVIIQKSKFQVSGFIADAQTITVDGRLYLVVAIFYDKEKKSHATESLIYEFDLQNQTLHLIQKIRTDGARVVHFFQTFNAKESYALIGCVKGKSESLLLRFDKKTRQFQHIRSFATGGSKHIASVCRNDKTFIILNNPDIEALQIFAYDSFFDNFYVYQNLYFQSKVTSLNVLYLGVGRKEAFVITTTKDGFLYVHEYMYLGKFQLKSYYWIDEVRSMTLFRHINQNYLFVSSKTNSTIFKVIQQGLQ